MSIWPQWFHYPHLSFCWSNFQGNPKRCVISPAKTSVAFQTKKDIFFLNRNGVSNLWRFTVVSYYRLVLSSSSHFPHCLNRKCYFTLVLCLSGPSMVHTRHLSLCLVSVSSPQASALSPHFACVAVPSLTLWLPSHSPHRSPSSHPASSGCRTTSPVICHLQVSSRCSVTCSVFSFQECLNN